MKLCDESELLSLYKSKKSEVYTDETLMPFGKHKGTMLQDVPASYLLWWYEEAKEHNGIPALAKYIMDRKRQLKQEARDQDEEREAYPNYSGDCDYDF